MPSTKPIFMGKLIYSSTQNKYAGLYFKSEKIDGSGTAEDQFYWINTDSSGAILDYRSNMLNGWYSSQASAESNLPSTYSITDIPIVIDDKYMIGFMPAWYTDGSFGFPYTVNGVVQTNNMHKYNLDSIKSMIDAGATYVIIPINLATLYYSITDYNNDTNNTNNDIIYSETVKTNLDGLVKNLMDWIQVNNKKVQISFRLETIFTREGWNDMRTWSTRLFEDSDLMLDNTGNIASGIYGRGSLSYSSTKALQVAKQFIINILRRYKSYANDRKIPIYWVSLVNSQTSEAEYGYENSSTIFGGTSPRFMDYSDNALSAFRTWLQSSSGGNYASIGAVSNAWNDGFTYTSFSQVTKERMPAWGVSDTDSLNSTKFFATKKGKDWYNFCVSQYVKFYTELKTLVNTYVNIGAGGQTVKFMLESGADLQEFDFNSSSYKRMTFEQSKIKDAYDIHKTWSSFYAGAGDNRNKWGAFQTDFARTNADLYNKRMGTELYANDLLTQQGISANVNDMLNAFKGLNTSLIKNKIKDIVYIAPNTFKADMVYQNESARLAIADAVTQISSISTFENPTTAVTFTIDYLLENGITSIFNLWSSNGGSTSNRLSLSIGSTTTGGGSSGGGGGTVLCSGVKSYTIYSDSQGDYHKYCLFDSKYASNIDNSGSNNGGNKYYNFDSAGKYTGTDGGLVNTHFVFALPTHSITNDNTTTSTLVMHQVEIYDNATNALLFKNSQFRGYRKTSDNSGNFNPNNSHPSNAQTGISPIYLNGDSTFFFELNRNYKVIIKNLAGVFTAKLENINADANTYRVYYEGKMNTSSTLEITINPTKILTAYIRGLKLVLDRFTTTDTIPTTDNRSLLAP